MRNLALIFLTTAVPGVLLFISWVVLWTVGAAIVPPPNVWRAYVGWAIVWHVCFFGLALTKTD